MRSTATSIPKKLQPILWSTDIKLLDIEKHKGYIIHQVLLYGTFEELQWLFDTYSKEEIIDTFINHPSRMYSKSAFYFIKNFILSLKQKKLTEDNYVTSISGPIRQRAAKSI